MTGSIEYTPDTGIGWIAFSNPEKRNAMSLDMWRGLEAAIAEATADNTVRVIVLRGEGALAFVAGSDISGFAQSRSSPDATHAYNATVESSLAALAACPKPTLAAIRGHCIGGGVSIAVACDLRLADDTSSYSVPAGRLGVGYSRQQIERLQQIVGPARLREIIFTGHRLSSADALAAGLVGHVFETAQFEAAVIDLATQIANNAPLTLAAAKRASRQALLASAERDDAATDALIDACFASEDYREGQAAFSEKRKPVFKGR